MKMQHRSTHAVRFGVGDPLHALHVVKIFGRVIVVATINNVGDGRAVDLVGGNEPRAEVVIGRVIVRELW